MRKKTTTRRAPVRRPAPRRRRISGVNNNPVMQIAGLVGGAIAARIANNLILKAKPDLNGKIINVVQIGLGIYLPKMIKSQLGKDLGAGMIAAGGLGLATSFGIINGIDVISGVNDSNDMIEMQLSGMDDDDDEITIGELDAINGLDVVNGMDDDNDYYN